MTDVAVIGAGVVGLAIARELRLRRPDLHVVVIDKEPDVGAHASGRNSGVLHAGFYYTADSLKARFCRDGNRELAAWCDANGVPVRRCGKLVVARSEAEHPALDALLRRGVANGVRLESVTDDEARAIEPRAKTVGRALYSPDTASVDPRTVMRALLAEVRALGAQVELGVRYLGRGPEALGTTGGPLAAGLVVNAAGVYADRVAYDFGVGERYRILPFRGAYVTLDLPADTFRAHVYPVPDLAHPFLGVHLTVKSDGTAKLGPTATPALWREHYGGLAGFGPLELAEIAWREACLFARAGFDFRALAWQEARKLSRARIVAEASALVDGLDVATARWGPPGIRAQLVDVTTRTLVSDFVVERGPDSIHVLNAVSPAFTSALPFARHVVDEALGR